MYFQCIEKVLHQVVEDFFLVITRLPMSLIHKNIIKVLKMLWGDYKSYTPITSW